MGPGLILPGTLALTVLLGPSMAHGRGGRVEPPVPAAAHFLFQHKSDCHFADGTAGAVVFQKRYVYGQEEFVRFDSRRGEYEACLDFKRGQVDHFCRGCYRIDKEEGLTLTRKGYYPSGVRFRWLKNGQEQTEGAGYADEIHNGDWTFLNQAMLETVPQRGDLYACQVEHSSLKEPITVQWEPQSSNSAQSKVWMGALGAVLGVVFGAAGVSFYLKTRR
ncbi:UNVERIFIED_CONTAM: hypothetical protein K2H54_066389, partial [Gekko kuhli]